ncbi:hypothetical protein ACSNOI_08415 [Actinomadura kijaniata]|uniref:P-loop NTPase n=1 Tax=Actinomadura kijaniata TaxID=46161 RepID=UPI003F1970BE
MNLHLNLLCLGSQADYSEKEAVLETLRGLAEQGEHLDAIVAFGGDHEVLDAVVLQCYDYNSQPPVFLVPGVDDLRENVAGRLITRALVKDWHETEADLWNGGYAEIIDTMRTRVFKEFLEKERNYDLIDGWQSGLLPGEGSARITVGGQQVGLVVVNTVFRMVGSPPDHSLASLSSQQLSHCTGGDHAEWRAGNNLTIIIASEPAPLPHDLPLDGSTLLLAGRQGTDSAWTGVEQSHHLTRVQFNQAGQPEVTDVTQGRKITLTQRTSGQEPTPKFAAEEPYQETEFLNKFYQQAESGRMVLVLISGVAKDIVDLDELREQITIRTYGGSLPSSPPSLNSVWPVAIDNLSEPELQSLLQRLRLAPGTQPPGVRNLLTCPWRRIYDFTGSNVLQVMAKANKQINARVFDACRDRPEEDPAVDVEIVAMHGIFNEKPTTVDFGPSQDPSVPRSLWLRQFQTDALLHPMAWMSASPGSQALWERIELIAPRGNNPLPSRFIIASEGTPADRSRLSRNGFTHIRQDPVDFAHTRLGANIEQLRRGHDRREALIKGTQQGKGVSLVSLLVKERPAGSRDYLQGHDPTWGDIVDGKAAKLSVVEAIRRASQPDSGGKQPIVLVKGRAGAGKTTALMHFAYQMNRAGKTVGWIGRETIISRRVIVDEVLGLAPDAMFVDDMAIFGSQASTLLRQLNRNGQTLVVASLRRTREDVLDATFRPKDVAADDPLNDNDLKNLVKVLKDNGLLGILKQDRFMHQRVNKLRELSGRSLLAAMIEVVTGQRFEDKVRSEYSQLSGERKLIYATVSFLQSEMINKQHGIEQGDLIQVVSHDAPRADTLKAISALVDQRLLIRTPDDSLRCRQKTFADTVVESILKGQLDYLEEIIRSLLIFYAQRGGHITRNDHPHRMVMIRLLNHEMMKRTALSYSSVRSIYDSVHNLLSGDFHYWLQRGQFELERGDLSIAANHLQSATGCIGGEFDHLVQTTSSSIRLRKATKNPKDVAALTEARTALNDLERIAKNKGANSPHTFAVMVRDGYNWLNACQQVVSKDDFLDLGNQILDICQLGKEVCKNNNQFLQVAYQYEPKIRRLTSVPM